MVRCPLCRAALNGAETCRRCRAELQRVQSVALEAQTLVGAAMHHLILDDYATATRLLQRALLYHAVPEVQALLQLVLAQQGGLGEEEAITVDDAPQVIGGVPGYDEVRQQGEGNPLWDRVGHWCGRVWRLSAAGRT